MGARCASFIPVGARRVCDLGSSRINAEERRPLGLVPTFTLIGHKIPDAARGGGFRIEAHQYSAGSVLGNLLNKELLPRDTMRNVFMP